jgi:flagellar biosynthesis protein FlhG
MRDDQATGLRRLFARRAPRPLGVGGDDATGVVVELALAMAELGTQVLVVDRTRGAAAVQLGLRARFELAHVLAGDLALESVLLDGPPRVTVLPAARGLDELALAARSAAGGWQAQLAAQLAAAGREADVWLVNGLPPTGSDADVLLAIRPTARAVTGAYAQMKALATLRGQRAFGVIVDRASSDSAARAAYAGLAEVARRFLSADLAYRGHVPGGAAQQRRAAFLHLAHALLPAPAHS